jgi:predicted hotdog family 3-hydroxylacyl-ACP dehydratase
MDERVPDDMATLLPHRGTASLLTEIILTEPGRIVAIGRIPRAHPLAVGSGAPCFLGLELGAQAAAAWEGIQRRGQSGHDGPRIGYLVGVRSSRFSRPHLPVDTAVTITADLEGAAPPLAVYRIAVAVEGIVFVTATLSTFAAQAAERARGTSSF